MCFIYSSLTFTFTSTSQRRGYLLFWVLLIFLTPHLLEDVKDVLLWWCATLGPGPVLVEISCCPTSSYLSVQALGPSSSHVPCFCQEEGERRCEILDVAHGLRVVPVALLHLVKRRGKNPTL